MNGSWKLIDLDAAVAIGEAVGTDKTSTAFCPPELAKILYRPKATLEELQEQVRVLLCLMVVSCFCFASDLAHALVCLTSVPTIRNDDNQ